MRKTISGTPNCRLLQARQPTYVAVPPLSGRFCFAIPSGFSNSFVTFLISLSSRLRLYNKLATGYIFTVRETFGQLILRKLSIR